MASGHRSLHQPFFGIEELSSHLSSPGWGTGYFLLNVRILCQSTTISAVP
ncbi:56_t:CDS:2 [Cetraspora pellucida]|uniref:56_t:CDS:1 n=1 Tax=Cetraspora pellucida TaxID=1433469 RepID=A0A9N9CHC4_9GLOM|nr:56_t:CDS:2 [Cetraspora pellucida]